MPMDTTSLYFEGQGGQMLGEHGFSKDHRPDLHQMILAVVIDGDGRPVCSEMWPGNTADVTSLVPVIDRLLAISPFFVMPTVSALVWKNLMMRSHHPVETRGRRYAGQHAVADEGRRKSQGQVGVARQRRHRRTGSKIIRNELVTRRNQLDERPRSRQFSGGGGSGCANRIATQASSQSATCGGMFSRPIAQERVNRSEH
jgi:hypothetical protein